MVRVGAKYCAKDEPRLTYISDANWMCYVILRSLGLLLIITLTVNPTVGFNLSPRGYLT